MEETEKSSGSVIREYVSSDFWDVSFLNQISYLSPEPDEVLRVKISTGKVWVWSAGMMVLGAIIVCPDLDKLWIWSLTVARAYQNQGWGNQLMQTAEDFYINQTLWLHTSPTGPANHLYTKRDWRTSQYLKNFYGKGMDAVEMYKALRPVA